MSRDNFDDEIADLYQQRKQQIVPPVINLTKSSFEKSTSTKKYTPIKLLAIFIAGSMASFVIMAIVSHFSTLKNNNTVTNTTHQVQIVEVAPDLTEEDEELPVTALPPVPPLTPPLASQALRPSTEKHNEQIEVQIINPSYASAITLPPLSKPKVIMEPIYKVLPKYSLRRDYSPKDGEVTFSYQVDTAGNTTNIDIVSSNVDRSLQRSAKKALAQWQYKPNEHIQNVEHQVIFKFTAQ